MKLQVWRAAFGAFRLLFSKIYWFMLVPALGAFSALEVTDYLFRAGGGDLRSFQSNAIRTLAMVSKAQESGQADNAVVWGVQLKWIAVMCAIYFVGGSIIAAAGLRYVLRPESASAFKFQFGRDELRIMAAWMIVLVCMIVAMTASLAPLWFVNFIADGVAVELLKVGVLILAFVVWVWVSIRISLAAPAAVASRNFGVRESFRITRGNVWRLILFWTLINVPCILLNWTIQYWAFGVPPWDERAQTESLTKMAPEMYLLTIFALFLIFAAFTIAASGTAYLHLTRAKSAPASPEAERCVA